MIQALQSWSIRKLFALYIAFVAVMSLTVAAIALHLWSPDADGEAHGPTYEDLDWAPAGIEVALLHLSSKLADMELGKSKPGALVVEMDELREAVEQVSANEAVTQSLGVLPEYTTTLMDLADLKDRAREVLINGTAPDLESYRQHVLDIASEVHQFAQDAQQLEARARKTRNRELSGSHKWLAGVLTLVWGLLMALGWAALIALRIQALRVSEYQEVAAARKRALDAAIEAELAQATFLGKVSHEINSPLQSILTNVQLLESRTASDDRRMILVSRLQTSVRQLCTQVADLLGVAEMKSGGSVKLNPEMVDIYICLRDSVAVLKSGAMMKGISLRLVSSDLGMAFMDGRRLSQILTNLVTNAIRYTDSGGVTVEASVAGLNSCRHLRLAVSDTGSGISVEAQKRLFQPFADTRTARRGSGLGLSIVKGLVEQMNGQVLYRTQEGKGTTFTVTLPLTAQGSEVFVVPVAPQDTKRVPSANNGRVLVVEDDKAIEEAIGELLADEGYDVTCVQTATAARAVLCGRDFDLVMLDLELPDGSGFDVAHAARQTRNATTPLWAMTAYAELLNHPDVGLFAERLVKPIDALMLYEMLDKAPLRVSAKASVAD
jgi:signal transduction histidine kinase/CheY-like chemotaxis protein